MIRNGGTPKNVEIEALRGVAVLMILYAHMGSVWFGDVLYNLSRNYIQPGTGVDLFFCISGYVITLHFAKNVPYNRSWASFVEFAVPFWLRRFWRLAPSAWLWLSSMLAVSFAVEGRTEFLRNLYDVVAAVLQIANFHLYDCRVGLTQTVCGRAGYFWSLSLEEQFYFVFPFLVFFLPRRMLIGAMVVVVLIQIALTRTPLLWLIRTDALALGVLIALLQQSVQWQRTTPLFIPPIFKWAPFVIGIPLVACLEAPQFYFVTFATGLVAIVSAILIWLASFERGYAVPEGWLRRMLVFLGARSYALYIIHVPAIWFVSAALESILGTPPSAMTLAIAIPSAMFAAVELNYRLIEMPFRRYGVKVAAGFRAGRKTGNSSSAVNAAALRPPPGD